MPLKSKFSISVRAMAIVLLFAMVHYVAGYRLLYSFGILYTKDAAKECMAANSNIKKFTLSTSDFDSLKWTEKSKEFSLHNQMYDVVSIQKLGAFYTITTYADNPETELVNAFHDFENELFHPDQANKNSKSAEDILSAFQKECTPISELKIHTYAKGLLQPSYLVPIILGQVSDNIWHPPAIC